MYIPASITQQCDDLAQLLGTDCMPFLLVSSDTVEVEKLHKFYSHAIQPHANITARAIEQSHQNKKFVLLPTEENGSVFSIPLMANSTESYFAIGHFETPATDSLRQLIFVASEAIRRQNQIDAQDEALLLAESELDRSYRERLWLKQLNLQRSVRKRSSGQQSKQTIESLRALIDAEAVAIFVYSDCDFESHGLESMITNKSNWTLEDVRLLLQKVPKPISGDSVVFNQVELQLTSSVLRSGIIVPVGELEPIGFLIALNRRKQSARSVQNPDNEFRSCDAELLHEAATYLLSDGHNNVHFQDSEQLVLGTLRAMSNAIEARDPYTHGHSERVARVGYEISVRLQLSEVTCQEIYIAGILHDIGKIGIPDHVLLKPGKLDSDEMQIIQKHPAIGFKILEGIGKLRFALPGVLHHHERIDGTGYPHRLKGDEIPLMARILAVSDAYDAMTSSRIYRNAMNNQRAVEILSTGAGTQWDHDAVRACLDYLSEEEVVTCDGTIERVRTKQDDWRQVSQALHVLQL